MKGADLITELKRKFGVTTSRALRDELGISHLRRIRDQKSQVTPRQVAGLLVSAQKRAVERSQSEMIRPVVEFYPIKPVPSKDGAGKKFRLFPTGKNDTKYTDDLRDVLNSSHGIYIFYDTRGRAIYAGKAKELTLWREMNNVLNRERTSQTVYRVKHPKTNVRFRTMEEKNRQPRMRAVLLHEMAAYISAYQVERDMIDSLEALLVRGFANDLLNSRMEKF